jgi:hypothetical protein
MQGEDSVGLYGELAMKAVSQSNRKGRGNDVQSGPIGVVNNNKGARGRPIWRPQCSFISLEMMEL